MARRWAAVLLVWGLLVTGGGRAQASMIYRFESISPKNPDSYAIEAQLQMTVYGPDDGTVAIGSSLVTVGANQALFVFTNPVGIASNIAEFYFQQGSGGPLASLAALYNNNTDFTHGTASPGNLPGGNSLAPNFRATDLFKGDNGNGRGVDAATRSVGVLYDLTSGLTYADVLAALDNGHSRPDAIWKSNGTPIPGGPLGLRVGLHVRSIGPGGGSASFLNTVAVPEPSSIALLGSGGLALALAAVRRHLPGACRR